MKRFAFRLEKLLRLRSQQTDQAKRAFAAAMAQEAEARRALDGAKAALAARLTEIGQRERAGISVYEFASLRTFVAYLDRQLEQAQAELAAAAARTERSRQGLLEARRKERALEKLKARRREAYDLEALREEQKELDEFGDRQGLNDGSGSSEI